MVNVNGAVRRQFPNWNQRGKVRKMDADGNILANEHACGGEIVRISPRFMKHGTNYRVRPERPAVFFAAFCYENGLIPSPLTPEECESDQGIDLLQPLWDAYKEYLPKLESPFAACDQSVQPSLKVGYSFCVPQVLIENIGSVRSINNQPNLRPTLNGNAPSPLLLQSLKAKIEAMRAKTGVQPAESTPPSTKAKKG